MLKEGFATGTATGLTVGLMQGMGLGIAIAAFALSGCSMDDETGGYGEGGYGTLSVEADRIVNEGGETVLTLSTLPDVRVDEQSKFGAGARFMDAVPSPDGGWFAVTSVGAAHGAGWLVRTGEGRPWPVAFQYGGDVSIGAWSDSGRYVALLQDGPAGGRGLVVADREQLRETVADNGVSVKAPGHAGYPPDERHYRPLEWEGDQLVFEVFGTRWRFSAQSGNVREDSGD